MVKCYASCLENCSDKQSKEHYISKGIWRNDVITFDGFHWMKGETKTLPVLSVASKILCTTHNPALSRLDIVFQKLFDIGAKFHNNQYNRGKLKRSAIWKPDRETFDGYDLERLLAKIAVGVIQEEPSVRWHPEGTLAIDPPREIVEVIFGNKRFQPPMGLYFVNSVGDTIINEDRVTIHTTLHPDTGWFIGAIVAIRHWQLFINLSEIDPMDYNMESVSGKNIGKNASAPVYRIQQINFNAGSKLSGRITIDWGDFRRDAQSK